MLNKKRYKKIIHKEILICILFLFALATKQILMILPIMYIIFLGLNKLFLSEIMAIFVFCIPFSNVVKLSPGHISLVSFIQVLYIFKYILNQKKLEHIPILNKNGLVILLFIIISTLINGNFLLMRFVNFAMFFIMLFINRYVENEYTFKLYGVSFALGTVLSCVAGYFKNIFVNVSQFISYVEAMNNGDEIYDRFMGLTEDPNILSAFILFSIAIIIVLYLNKLSSKWFCLIMGLILLYFGMLTYSKMFLIGILLIIIVTCFLYIRREYLMKMIFFMIFIFLGVLFAYKKGLFDNFLVIMEYRLGISSNSDFSSGRFDIWIRYIKSMNEHIHSWIIGYGIRGNLLALKASHNSIIQLFYSLGLIGSFLYVRFIKDFVWKAKNRNMLLLLFSIAWAAMSVDVFDQDYFYCMLIVICSARSIVNLSSKGNKIMNMRK